MPEADAVNVAVEPACTVWSIGCSVIAGAIGVAGAVGVVRLAAPTIGDPLVSPATRVSEPLASPKASTVTPVPPLMMAKSQ